MFHWVHYTESIYFSENDLYHRSVPELSFCYYQEDLPNLDELQRLAESALLFELSLLGNRLSWMLVDL